MHEWCQGLVNARLVHYTYVQNVPFTVSAPSVCHLYLAAILDRERCVMGKVTGHKEEIPHRFSFPLRIGVTTPVNLGLL